MNTIPPGVPWLTDGAIAAMDDYLTPEMNVLEFGAGGSTVWFSKRCRVVPVGHDRKGFDSNANDTNTSNSQQIVCPRPYCDVCDRWEDGAFDLVLVDGRDRVLCAEKALRLIKPGGLLVVDNYERRHYRDIGNVLCRDWKRTDHEQTEPNSWGFWYETWLTTIWEKPA